MCVHVTPPPPKPPFRCPHPDKKGTNLLLFQTGIYLHTHILIKTWDWSVAELWGKFWDTDAHAHVTYQAPITGLHNSTLLPFLQNSTDYFMVALFCKFGVNCWSIGLTYPVACTRARVPLTFGQVHRPPPYGGSHFRCPVVGWSQNKNETPERVQSVRLSDWASWSPLPWAMHLSPNHPPLGRIA